MLNSDSHHTYLIPEIQELYSKIGYRFKKAELLREALTHPSYREIDAQQPSPSYERLEFLGDSIIQFTVTEYLFSHFKNKDEGELSKFRSVLVSRKNIAECAKHLNLSKHIIMSENEEKTGGRNKKSILSDCFEALVGALFLDAGPDTSKKFVLDKLIKKSINLAKGKIQTNFKSRLQEYIQKKGRPSPEYKLKGEMGPDHAKTFVVQVIVGDKIIGEGIGKTKKDAEQMAAKSALKREVKNRD
ncbi:MAG: ribonuclease III [Fidelibacterota bacterium]